MNRLTRLAFGVPLDVAARASGISLRRASLLERGLAEPRGDELERLRAAYEKAAAATKNDAADASRGEARGRTA